MKTTLINTCMVIEDYYMGDPKVAWVGGGMDLGLIGSVIFPDTNRYKITEKESSQFNDCGLMCKGTSEHGLMTDIESVHDLLFISSDGRTMTYKNPIIGEITVVFPPGKFPTVEDLIKFHLSLILANNE